MKFGLLLFWMVCLGIEVATAVPGGEKVVVVTLEKNAPAVDVHFKDMVTNFRMVRLETTDDCLLPAWFTAWCGDRHIVVITEEQIFQFDGQGRFVRSLAVRGRGPGEYASYAGFVVDEEQDRFYLADREQRLYEYDLRKGSFVASRRIGEETLATMVLDKEKNIYFLPEFYLENDCTYDLGCMTTEGKRLGEVKGKQRKARDKSGYAYLGQLSGKVRFCSDYADTLYTLAGVQKIPDLFLSVPDRFSPLKKIGNMPQIIAESNHSLLLNNYYLEADPATGQLTAPPVIVPFRVDKSTAKASIVINFYIDWMNDGNKIPAIFRSGHNLWCSKPMLHVRSQAEKALAEGKLSPEKTIELRKFLQETHEDDNPVIFIGKE